MTEPKYKVDLDKYSDAQIITFHRECVLSNGEFVDEMVLRGKTDEWITGVAQANFCLRMNGFESGDYLH